MKNQSIRKWIFLFTLAILIVLEFFAFTIEGHYSHYKYDFIFLTLLLLAIYYLRDRLDLHWFHFLLFSIFLILHDLGMFRLYEKIFFGWIEYDYILHVFFGLVIAFVLLRAYAHHAIPHGFMKFVFVITLVLGFSAAHELYEFGGAVILGEGEGVLFMGAGDLDQWDTQKDMLNNLIGGVLGCIAYLLIPIKHKNES